MTANGFLLTLQSADSAPPPTSRWYFLETSTPPRRRDFLRTLSPQTRFSANIVPQTIFSVDSVPPRKKALLIVRFPPQLGGTLFLVDNTVRFWPLGRDKILQKWTKMVSGGNRQILKSGGLNPANFGFFPFGRGPYPQKSRFFPLRGDPAKFWLGGDEIRQIWGLGGGQNSANSRFGGKNPANLRSGVKKSGKGSDQYLPFPKTSTLCAETPCMCTHAIGYKHTQMSESRVVALI